MLLIIIVIMATLFSVTSEKLNMSNIVDHPLLITSLNFICGKYIILVYCELLTKKKTPVSGRHPRVVFHKPSKRCIFHDLT